MSAMSAESKTSPPTKHTALSVAKTPDDEHNTFHKPAPKPVTIEQRWTAAQEARLRALVADYAKLWHNDHHEEFWRMLHSDMAKEFGAYFECSIDDAARNVFPAERWVRERKQLRDFLGIKDARQSNGIGHVNGTTGQNGHSKKTPASALPDMGSFRKKRKVGDGNKTLDQIVVNGGHVNGDTTNNHHYQGDVAEPVSAIPAINGTETLPSPADLIKDEDAMQTEDAAGLPDAMASILNSTNTTPNMSELYSQIDFYLREIGLSDENTSHDAVIDSYDIAFNIIKKQLDSFGRAEGGLAVLIMMTYRLVRDNHIRVLSAADENDKEQKKRKWNDDVLWSMINDKCAQVGLRAGEDLNRLAKLVEEKMPKMRDDIVQALGGPSLPQMQYINPKMLDCQLTPDEPPLAKHSRSQSLKNGYREYSSTSHQHDRSRSAAEVDTTMLVQKMQKLMEQREADAKLIEQQKLVILQMDRRLQYLESRIAGVA